MKKLLGIAITAILLFPSGSANAELFKNLKVKGSLDVQANSARNVSDFFTRDTAANDRIGNTLTRTLVDMDWDLLDDVHANITLRKNDRPWGTVGLAATQGAAGGQGLIGAPAAGDAASNVIIQRASVKVDNLMDRVDLTVGRQYYGDPGDLIIFWGPKDVYGLFVTSFDGARFEHSNDWMDFSGLWGTPSGAGPAGVAAGQASTNMHGFNIWWKGLPLKASTYLYRRVTQAAGALGTNAGKNDYLWVYGTRLRGEAMGGWLGLDLAFNSGECRAIGPTCGAATEGNYQGRAFLLDLGYNAEVANVGNLTPWANFGWGSGRSNALESAVDSFQQIASDYRPGIINRRFNASGSQNLTTSVGAATPMGTVGLSNRVIWGVGVNVAPSMWEKLQASVQFWDYRFQRATLNSGAFTSAVGNKHIGSEFGVTFDWNHSENVRIGWGLATFQPGGYIKENNNRGAAVGNNPVQYAFADMSIRW